MFITCILEESIVKGTSSTEKVVIDVDPHDDIENLKVVLSLKLNDVDPKSLIIFYQNRRLNEKTKIISIGIDPSESLFIKKADKFCILI